MKINFRWRCWIQYFAIFHLCTYHSAGLILVLRSTSEWLCNDVSHWFCPDLESAFLSVCMLFDWIRVNVLPRVLFFSEFVRSKIVNRTFHLWIGLHRAWEGEGWFWLDNSAYSSGDANWDDRQPNSAVFVQGWLYVCVQPMRDGATL